MRAYRLTKIFFLLFLICGCKKESFISGKYLMQGDYYSIFSETDTVHFMDRELELINSCKNCDALQFNYHYDSGNPEQKFYENTYLLHVFGDSVFGEWNITIGPERPKGFWYSSTFTLYGSIIKDKKNYFIEGSIISYGSYSWKDTGSFTIRPIQ